MTERRPWWDPRANPVGWISGALVLAGFLCTGPQGKAGWWVILLTGLGTFGPGVLRELGWLRDKDEFQLQAARRAGYHAFLTTGLVAFLWIAFLRSGTRNLKTPEELPTFFAALLWFTWFWSSLSSYWGPRKTAFRVLVLYGIAWLLFNILGHLQNPVAMLMQCLITLPFFGGAWLSTRWPRLAGALLLVASAVLANLLLRLHHARDFALVVSAITLLLFVGPLVASGLALVVHRPEDEAPPAEEAR